MHDSTLRDLLEWEQCQRKESGHDTTALDADIEAALTSGDDSEQKLGELYELLLNTERAPDWRYDEPDGLDEITRTLKPQGQQPPVDETTLEDKILGGWTGRAAGCNLGKPVELGDYWTQQHIRDYLELAQAWPLADYIPALQPMPAGYELRECWPQTTLGNISESARDDDVDYTLLSLHLLETYGAGYTPADVAREWLDRLPYTQTYTAERATYRNLINGVPAEQAGGVNNPYREWIGAQIRADLFGFVNPGQPREAALLAYQDASLSHRGNGIYGQMWAAALVAAAFTADTPRDAVVESTRHIPPRSRLAEALREVVDLYDDHQSWETARQHVERVYGHYSWVHTVNNAMLVAAGILWGQGDFTETVALTVVGGLDTDSNGATAGSVAGVFVGHRAIPDRWKAPLNDRIRSSLAGFDGVRISDVAARTIKLLPARPTH